MEGIQKSRLLLDRVNEALTVLKKKPENGERLYQLIYLIGRRLKMVTDTLLSKLVTEEEQREFLKGIRNQTDKLEFLFQALVKTSQLETGAIRLEKKDAPLIDTLAMALSGIVYTECVRYRQGYPGEQSGCHFPALLS